MSLKLLFRHLKNTLKVCSGGYDVENCLDEIEAREIAGVLFSKWFISIRGKTPDLPGTVRGRHPFSSFVKRPLYTGGATGDVDPPHGRLKTVRSDSC